METKLLEYAYPTSTTAKKAGYYNTGCWFVSLYKTKIARSRILAYFPTKQEAFDYADKLPNEYNWMMKYIQR